MDYDNFQDAWQHGTGRMVKLWRWLRNSEAQVPESFKYTLWTERWTWERFRSLTNIACRWHCKRIDGGRYIFRRTCQRWSTILQTRRAQRRTQQHIIRRRIVTMRVRRNLWNGERINVATLNCSWLAELIIREQITRLMARQHRHPDATGNIC